MRVSEITTSCTQTDSNECKRTRCSFSTTPHPDVPDIHSTNERAKINETLMFIVIVVVILLSAFKKKNTVWGWYAFIRLHASYIARTPIINISKCKRTHSNTNIHAVCPGSTRRYVDSIFGRQNGAWRWNYDLILRGTPIITTPSSANAHINSNYYKLKRTRCSFV